MCTIWPVGLWLDLKIWLVFYWNHMYTDANLNCSMLHTMYWMYQQFSTWVQCQRTELRGWRFNRKWSRGNSGSLSNNKALRVCLILFSLMNWWNVLKGSLGLGNPGIKAGMRKSVQKGYNFHKGREKVVSIFISPFFKMSKISLSTTTFSVWTALGFSTPDIFPIWSNIFCLSFLHASSPLCLFPYTWVQMAVHFFLLSLNLKTWSYRLTVPKVGSYSTCHHLTVWVLHPSSCWLGWRLKETNEACVNSENYEKLTRRWIQQRSGRKNGI